MVLPIKCMPLVKKMPTDFNPVSYCLLNVSAISIFAINPFVLKTMMF